MSTTRQSQDMPPGYDAKGRPTRRRTRIVPRQHRPANIARCPLAEWQFVGGKGKRPQPKCTCVASEG